MRKVILALLGLALSACMGDGDSRPTYSFDDIVELRLSGNQSIDGEEIWIDSKLASTFSSQIACPAVVPMPCVDPETEDLSTYERVDEYGHERNSYEPVCAGRIYLNAELTDDRELLEIGYEEHSEFYMLPEPVSADAVIKAKVEYTEEVDYCAKKIYKGTKITLSEGEHEKLLNLLLDAAGQ